MSGRDSKERAARIARGGIAIIACAVAAACASANKAVVKQTAAESARSFAAGDYGNALALYRDLYAKEPGSAKVVAGYAAAVEETKKTADRAKAKGELAAAEGAYRALTDGWSGFTGFAGKLSFGKAEADAGLRDCRIALCEWQFREELRAGDFAKALASYQAALKEYPDEQTLKDGYVKGYEEIGAAAEKALAAKDYPAAGKMSRLLIRNADAYEAAAGAEAKGRVDKKWLNESLRRCSTGLTNLGLAEYRKGNLEKAVALWADLLAFDPENVEINKAVETAKAQLSRLKRMAPGGAKAGR